MTALPSLKELVDALPEVYQPIFGHPEFDSRASRKLEDRLLEIMKVYGALSRRLGRPLRVLDLGCAQGWFGFQLAKAGAQVFGVDILAANINVCNMLALENREIKTHFELMEIEQLPARLKDETFDLVLGLSVFHHLCLHNGKEATRELIRSLLAKIPAAIFEFALASETGGDFAHALPADPTYLIEQIPFFFKLSEHATHLSPVNRPLYFCSTRYWYFGGAAEEFESWRVDEHDRRYFFGAHAIAKLYGTVGEFGVLHRNSIMQAARFLKAPPPAFPSPPKFIEAGEANDKAWLVQEKIDGVPLSTLIADGKTYNMHAIIADILPVLAALEKAGLYHSDVRTWNVLIDAKGKSHLIDYGKITANKRDCTWPWSVFLAFFLFVHEMAAGKVSYTEPARQPFISPYNLPEPYRSWGSALWAKPVTQWSFGDLQADFQRLPSVAAAPIVAPAPDPSAVILWMENTELFLNMTAELLRSFEQPFRQLTDAVLANSRNLEHRIRRLEAALETAQKRAANSDS